MYPMEHKQMAGGWGRPRPPLASSVVPIALFLVSPEVGGGWGYSRLGILEVVFSSYTYLLGTKLISSHTQTKV